jgi:hypothetical protein
MKNLSWLFAIFALALAVSITGCCCCEDDESGETCPDLIVQSIDLTTLDVDCSGGGGTCVTTVTFTIANVGTADAGAFNVQTILDPGGSVVLNEFVLGLDAGDFITITVTSPPGGNCYDPDCTVTVIVDNEGIIDECDEENNKESATRLG